MAKPSAGTVVFLSDYGLEDPFVGLCHAVISGVGPQVRVIDLTHAVRAQDVAHGAVLLADCLPWLPAAATVLAVVDPGVGTGRRGIIVAAGTGASERLLVGPDNGLLLPAADRLGGPAAAWALPPLPGRASTFDGRDVFAPAAARLALGTPPDELGEPLPPAQLATLELPRAAIDGGRIVAEVVHVDGFGNLQLSAPASLLDDAGFARRGPVVLTIGAVVRPASVCAAFAEVPPGRLGVLPDAFNRLQVAVNRGSAARVLGAGQGDAVVISRADAERRG